MYCKIRTKWRWKNPPLHRLWSVSIAVLLSVQCSEKTTELAVEDRRIISALVEAIHLNRDLQALPDSLKKARHALLERHELTEARLNQWLEENQGNRAMWQEVAVRVGQAIEHQKKDSD